MGTGFTKPPLAQEYKILFPHMPFASHLVKCCFKALGFKFFLANSLYWPLPCQRAKDPCFGKPFSHKIIWAGSALPPEVRCVYNQHLELMRSQRSKWLTQVDSVEIMEVNTSLIFEEFLWTVSFVPTSLEVSYELRMLQLTRFFTPPSPVSKSISPFDHMAAGTHLLTHTAVSQVTVLSTCCTGELCNITCGYRATTPPTLSHFSQCNPRFGPTQSLATFQREACSSSPPPLWAQQPGIQRKTSAHLRLGWANSQPTLCPAAWMPGYARTCQQSPHTTAGPWALQIWLCSGDWNINSNFWEEWLHTNTPPS